MTMEVVSRRRAKSRGFSACANLEFLLDHRLPGTALRSSTSATPTPRPCPGINGLNPDRGRPLRRLSSES